MTVCTKLPLAVVTVHFNRQPVSGIQLAALTKLVAERYDDRRFVALHQYYDGDILSFGQTSGYPHKHIRIVPSLDGLPFFRSSGAYSEALVTSYSWRYHEVPAADVGRMFVIETVKRFAAELTAEYEHAVAYGFPEYVEVNDFSEVP